MNKKLKFSKMFYIVLSLLLILTAFIWYVVISILINEILDRTAVYDQNVIVLFYGASLAVLSYTFSLINLLIQLFIYKSPGEIKEDGIYNVNVGGVFLAFVFIIRVPYVPWEHLYFNGLRYKIKSEYLPKYRLPVRFILIVKGLGLFTMYSKLPQTFYEKALEDQIQEVGDCE